MRMYILILQVNEKLHCKLSKYSYRYGLEKMSAKYLSY